MAKPEVYGADLLICVATIEATMPKRKRAETTRKGWKKRCNDIIKDGSAKCQKLWSEESIVKAIKVAKSDRMEKPENMVYQKTTL